MLPRARQYLEALEGNVGGHVGNVLALEGNVGDHVRNVLALEGHVAPNSPCPDNGHKNNRPID